MNSTYTLNALAAFAAMVLGSASARAQCDPQQVAKLLPDDGESTDNFGGSVGISGATAIAGAYGDDGDDDSGYAVGSAYLFDTTTGQQLLKLIADDGANGDLFGLSVAISGTTAIVGARSDDDNGSDSGSAYLFDTTTGQQIAKLLPDDGAADDEFGISVAISGTTAIVGAYWDEDNGNRSGSAYLFDTTTGQQIAKLLPDDGAADDDFGVSVAISGTTAIVGANFDDDNGDKSGSAYLFDITTGQQIAKLLPNDGAADSWFGTSVAISHAIAIVGAPDSATTGAGSAYLFDSATGAQIAKLVSDDAAMGDLFGYSVAISGTTAFVGAPTDDDNGFASGSAYLFDTTTGRQIAKLLADDGAEGDVFGVSVALSGANAIIGAVNDEDNGWLSGSGYLFDVDCQVDCEGDTNNDGIIDPLDSGFVLARFGCPVGTGDPDCDTADQNGDGLVDPLDVGFILARFGPCS